MNNFDTKGLAEYYRNNDKVKHYQSALDYLEDITIKHKLENKPHTFTCGTEGEVVKKLTIEIDFDKAWEMQPHADFAENLCEGLVQNLLSDVEGYIDNDDMEE